MTLRAIGGLVVFNLFILGSGAAALWGIRGWRWWTEAVRLSGLAYLLGVSALMVLVTLEIVVGIPIGVVTMLLSGAGLVALGLVAGRMRGFAAPGLRPPGWRFPPLSLFAALFVAGIIVYLESLFRAQRLAGSAREWDSWAFWIPRAKDLYFTGHLEPDFLLRLQQGPSYPPGVATIQAGAFRAMGSPDAVTLHLEYWFFAVAFVVAVTGILAHRVRPAILFPVLLTFLVAPSLLEWITTVYADIPLGYLVAVAALLVILWIEEREPWQLAAATVLLAGAMLTKREGLLFAACVVLAGLVASIAERRQLWPRLIAAGALAFVLVLPWRIWFTAHGFPGDGPETGYFGIFSHLERVWPSARLVVSTLFDHDLWRIAPLLGMAAIAVALIAGAWRVALFTTVFVVAALAAATWVFWSNVSLGLTSGEWAARRITGTNVLVLAVLTPLLLERAWSYGQAPLGVSRPRLLERLGRQSRVGWVIVGVAALTLPAAMLLGYSRSGLPGALPHFPSARDCIVAPAPGEPVRVVVGYADTYPEANALRRRARTAGLGATEVAQDGCGRLRVFVGDVSSQTSASARIASARTVGLDLTMEAAARD